MKFTLSALVLALAATQVQAIVPTPVKGCTQFVMITPADTSCSDLAAKFGTTFEKLRAMNLRLDAVCANLDVGYPICVSITGPNLGTLTSTPPYPGQTGVPTTSATAPLPTITSSKVLPPVNGTTTGASVTVTTPVATSGTASTSATPKATTTASAASSSKASFVLGAAGVLLSFAYML